MRIGIDARMMGKGYGIGRYIEELVYHLGVTTKEHTFVLFVPKEFSAECEVLGKSFECITADVPWYSFAEQRKMPSIIANARVDLMHFPHWNVPVLYRGPFVLTIHDLTMFHHARPEATTHGPFLYWLKDRVHRALVRYATRRAYHVVVPSEWVKQDVLSTCTVSNDKVSVIYEAPTLPIATQKHPGTYALYVGSAYPHKNLSTLLSAWKHVEAEHNDITLVFAGKDSVFYDRLKQSDEWNALTRVQHLGFVPDDELPALYASAQVFVFPSLSEGFGIPPLEAMQQGTPVVASSATCLPEILGEAARYVDAQSAESIADGILQLLGHVDLKRDLIHAGRKQVAQYDWQHSAKQMLEVYELWRTART